MRILDILFLDKAFYKNDKHRGSLLHIEYIADLINIVVPIFMISIKIQVKVSIYQVHFILLSNVSRQHFF